MKNNIQFPFGAVYFRKSNPPREDWERDYKAAANNGVNIFRHWALWGSIEVEPGVYDWDDYDKQMELSEKYGIGAIFTVRMESVPEWLFNQKPELLHVDKFGNHAKSAMCGSSVTGGSSFGNGGGVCLDNEKSRVLAGRFISELAQRYKDHPALLGYDVWNECNFRGDICYCDKTRKVFIKWLKEKYSSLESLRKTWHRYTLSSWDDINIPSILGPYPESEDWLLFRRINFYKHRDWRIDVIKQVDTKALIAAHGMAGSLRIQDAQGADDWLAAKPVEIYGLTWVAARKGNAPWQQYHAIDMTRAGANGKPIWHAEIQGGPLWLQPQCPGRPKSDGRIVEPEDVRIWYMISLSAGIRGAFNPRWRPLLDGPLFGAFGARGMDGTDTKRSEAASAVGKWANASEQSDLMASKSVKGDLGILVIPLCQTFDYLLSQSGGEQLYFQSAEGAYKGFFEHNIQSDWVRLEQINEYDLIYLPLPIRMDKWQAEVIQSWVKKGGTLICEGTPAYFGLGGRVEMTQPGLNFDEVFGVRERSVEFMPDIAEESSLDFDGKKYQCSGFIQTYDAPDSRVRGRDDDGNPIIVENTYGKGKTLLIGTHPSIAVHKGVEQNAQLYKDLFDISGKCQYVKVKIPSVIARLSESDNRSYLWLTNPSSKNVQGRVKVNMNIKGSHTLYGVYDGQMVENELIVKVPARDALIIELRP